jgi:hypothetical protein
MANMDQFINTITVRISGKNKQGEPFQELATLEQFGNFGVVIHTTQQLRLSERVSICGRKGETIASAEVVWVRAGDLPAVEALLYRNQEAAESQQPEASAPAVETPSAPQQPVSTPRGRGATSSLPSTASNSPATAGRGPVSGRTSATAGLSRNTDETTEKELSQSGTFRTDRSLSTSSTKRLPRERRDETVEPRQTRQLAQAAAQNSAKIATLQQHRKIALAALVVLAIFFVAALLPVGSAAPTPIDLLEQNGCLDTGKIKDQASEAGLGDLECWTQANNGAVQFVRREDITLPQTAEELSTLRRDGLTPRGYWCPKSEGRLVENPDPGKLPAALSSVWSIKPVGTNAATVGELTMQWKDGQLLLKETTKDSVIDRSQGVGKVVYYAGLQKFVVKMTDESTASVETPMVKELIFYIPKGQETIAAAEGQLTNSLYQIYIAQSSPPQRAFPFSIRQIIAILLGLAIAVTFIYLAINFQRVKNLNVASYRS